MFKAWTPEGFARVIDELNSLGCCVVLISGPARKEIDYVSAILETTDSQPINFAGQLSLNESAALIKLADCFIGLDSVASHIAAAVNTPCVVLFGPSTDTVWRPWMIAHRVIFTDFACRPCGLKGCGDGMLSECIQAIPPQKVVQAAASLMQVKAVEQEI
jgi:heptosyltransferase-3